MNGNASELTGAGLPRVPRALVELFQLQGIKHRHRHWVAQGKDGYYKLAPFGSIGQTHLKTEGEVLARMDHPHVVKGFLVSRDGWEILRVDRVAGEPLSQIRDRLSTATKMQILDEIEGAVRYVNSQGLLHADVCAPNILWDGQRSCLIDFEEAIAIAVPKRFRNSPDVIGGAPCCWGDVGYGYKTYLCLDSLREWLLTPEFLAIKDDLNRSGVWNPQSLGNVCEPWSTPDNGTVYQSVSFGNESVSGQRDPDLRFRRLSTRKILSFGDKRVLDIGCNFGRLGAFLAQLGIHCYVGLDLDKNYIAFASRLSDLERRKTAHFLLGDICDGESIRRLREISPQGYDIVICQSVYHHINDKRVFWDSVVALGTRWFIFEGPIDDAKYLLMDSWQAELEFIRTLGYEQTWQSDENDYPGRILAVFEKVP